MMSCAWRIVTAAADGARVYLGLGTNLGDRAAHLCAAVRALREVLDVAALSDVYESDPVGFLDQPRFWNMALRAYTARGARQLLDDVKGIELRLGREPAVRMGPRSIDIDVLLYDALCLNEPDIQIPHPRLHERNFVLQPLTDLDDTLLLPHIGVTAAQQLARCGGGVLVHVGTAADVLRGC